MSPRTETPQPPCATWGIAQLPSKEKKKKSLPNVQREPPVFQFVPIASSPVSGQHRAEPGSVLYTASLKVFI